MPTTPRAYNLWFGKPCVYVAVVALCLACVLPPEGPGIPLCLFHNATGLPCPGCGLTRSLSSAMHGLFQESWRLHPMGPLILILFFLTVAQRVMPSSFREKLAGYMNSRRVLFGGLYPLFVTAFVSFGVIRAVVTLAAR